MEVTSSEIEANAREKNLLWILLRLYAAENQTISGWTGFNITVRNELEVSMDNQAVSTMIFKRVELQEMKPMYSF